MDVLCLGEPLIELNRQPDGRWLEGFGGDASNVAVAAARQGASAGMLAHVGDDRFGDALLAMWAREGVATTHVARHPAPTGIYFVDHDEGGHHFSYRRAGSAASLMGPEDVPHEVVAAAKIFHASGISQAISPSAADAVFHAMDVAREAGVTVSYDTNLRLKLWPLARARALTHEAAGRADVLLPGLDDSRTLTGLEDPEAIAKFYADLGPRTVALTMGADGVLVRHDGRTRTLAAHATTVVDASGAGDCFDGAFLARLAAGDDPFDAARYANVAAALKVRGYGAVAPIPARTDVLAAMEEAA